VATLIADKRTARRAFALAAVALFLTLAAPGAYARSFRAECEARLKPTNIRVEPELSAYTTTSALSTHQLSVMSPPGVAGEYTVGLTVAQLSSRIEFEQNGLHQPETNEDCTRLHIRVTLSYNPITVYVGREFRAGSCAYREVLQHEQKHVAAYEQHLRDAAANVEISMRAHFGNTIHYGDPQALQAGIAADVKTYWLPLAQQQLADVERYQKAIDTPEEYERNRSVCNGDIVKIPRGLR
jgi:hypothetical protein